MYMKRIQFSKIYLVKFIGVLILFFVGIGIGSQYEKGKNKTEEVYSQNIAIVNSDQGVEVDGKQINYAARILNTISGHYVMSGIQDAQEGVQSGKYAAYVIIPSDFSEHVVSLNHTPERAKIQYALSNIVTKDCKVGALEEVETLNAILNNGMSYMYIDGILSEFHSVQDGAETIMENDRKDTDIILAIHATDLTELITIPELQTAENEVAPLDVQEYLDKDRTIVEDINRQYEYYIRLSEEDWEQLQKQGNDVIESWTRMEDDINNFSISKDENGNLIYEEGIENILELVNQNDSSLNDQQGNISETFYLRGWQLRRMIQEYNSNLNSAKTELRSRIAEEYEKNAIESGSSPYSLKVNDSEISYYTGNEKIILAAGDYVKTIDAMLQSSNDMEEFKTQYQQYIEENTRIWNENGDGDYLTGLKKLSENTGLVESGTFAASIRTNLVQPDISLIVNEQFPDFDDALTEATLGGDKEENLEVSLSDLLRSDAESVKLSVLGENEIKDILQENFIDVMENQSESEKAKLVEKYETQKKGMETYITASGQFNPYQYINQQEINQSFLLLNQNGSELQKKINEDYSQNMSYVTDVTMNASENMSNVMEAITSANVTSQEKLESGLEEAKQVKSDTYETNQELLQDFTLKLPYTRIGKLEYAKAYEFIADPTELSEVQVSGSVSRTDEKKTEIPIWIWIIAGGVVIGIGYGIYRRG